MLSIDGELARPRRWCTLRPRYVDDARLLAAARGCSTSPSLRNGLTVVYGPATRFILLCEGSSDRALVPHLERLLVSCGATAAVGFAIPLSTVRDPGGGGSVLERKLGVVLAAETEYDLLFVHRDADAAGHEARTREIIDASANMALNVNRVPIVPVRATEAWILLDEAAIRRVAGKPRGRQPLNLPRPSRVEQLADPKGALDTALASASGCRGYRLRKFRSRFGQHRRILLEQLPIGGALDHIPAWARLREAVSALVAAQQAP